MYVCMYVYMYVCVCARVCMHVCGSAAAQTDESILMKFSTNGRKDICEIRFSQILKFQNR